MPTWSQPISLKGATGSNATLPQDFTPNSVAIAPISGDATTSQLTQKDASGNVLFASDKSGNVAVAGTLSVAGASALAAVTGASATWSGNESVGGNLNVTGTATVGALTASATNIAGNQVISGNDTVNGDLVVKGSTSLQALTAAGTSTLAAVNATSANVSGNTTLAATSCSTLQSSGTATLNAANVTNNLTVGGNSTLKAVTATTISGSGNATVGGTLTVTGIVNPLGNLNVNGNGLVQGDFTCNGKIQAVGALVGQASAAITNNLSVGGTTTLAATNVSSLTATGNINVSGSSTLGSTLPASLAVTNNATVGGTLKVTGATTLAGTTTGALTASSVANSGNEAVGGTLNVTGQTTLAAASCTSLANSGNETVGGTLAVTGATTAAAIASSATVQAKNLTLTSGGGGNLTFADGTTLATAPLSGSADPSYNSLTVAPVSGNTTASAITQKASGGGTLFSSDTSGNVQVAGTLKATGASTLAALSATSMANSGNETIGGTLAVTGATTAAALTSSATVTAKNITLASGGGGVVTFADGSTQSTAATGSGGGGTSSNNGAPSRSVVFLGTFWNNSYTANTANNTYHATINTNGGGAGATGAPFRFDQAGAIVGYSFTQAGPVSGTNTIQFYKNGTAFGAAINAGSGNNTTTSGAQIANTVYTYAAGDILTAYVSNSSGGNTQISLHATLEWTYASSGTSVVTYNRAEIYMGNIVNQSATANNAYDLRPPGTTAVSFSYKFPRNGVIYGFSLTGTTTASSSIGAFVNKTPSGATSGSDVITLSGSLQAISQNQFNGNGLQYTAPTPISINQGDTIVVKPGTNTASTLNLVGFLSIGLAPQTT